MTYSNLSKMIGTSNIMQPGKRGILEKGIIIYTETKQNKIQYEATVVRNCVNWWC